jgi:hypothetical protein
MSLADVSKIRLKPPVAAQYSSSFGHRARTDGRSTDSPEAGISDGGIGTADLPWKHIVAPHPSQKIRKKVGSLRILRLRPLNLPGRNVHVMFQCPPKT